MTRIVGLWFALIILFVAIYAVFGVSSSGTQPASPTPPAYSQWALLAWAVSLVPFAAWFLRFRKGALLNNGAVKLMGEGRFVGALEKFEAAAPKLGRRAMVYFNLGTVKLSLWRIKEALADFEVAKRKRLGSPLKEHLPSRLALSHALLGNVGEARVLLAGPEGTRAENDALAGLARAVVQCRERAWADAASTLERNELRMLGGVQRGIADALRAWSNEQLGRARSTVNVVAVVGEASLEKVREVWPELAEFLESATAVPAAVAQR